jgi:biotin-dependent carboxylase-like uncharacterized protein
VIEVLSAGPLTTVQDLGRPGLAHLGVGRSGAADRPSLRLANRLVGNAEVAAGLEVTFGGLAVRFERACTVALAGATCPVLVGGRAGDVNAPVGVAAGEVLELGMPPAGVRTYLAVRGGLAVEPVLGARATDLLAGLGPEPLRDGDRLPIGRATGPGPGVDVAPVRPLPPEPVLRVVPGPRADWFTTAALEVLATSRFEVTAASDRVGVRLAGPALERSRGEELPSEGLVEGAVQVPPDGQPVVFLADHPVTGGYPVIAVVHPDDLPAVAQARPGQVVRFTLEPALA